jgi:hypothetical protein
MLAGLRQDWQFAVTSWDIRMLHVGADAVEVAVEEAGAAFFTKKD